MRGFHVKLLVVCLISLVFAGSAFAVPKITDVKIQPTTAWVDDHLLITAAIDDPAKEVAKVEAVVVEYPEITLPLNDEGKGDDKTAGDGIWSGGADIPSEAFEGTYHIAIWPKSAAGSAFKVDGEFLKATVAVTLKPGAKAEQPASAPAPAPAVTGVASLSNAKVEPATVKPGDHVVITATVADPAKTVAKVEAIVTEYPVMKLPLNDAGQGDDKAGGDSIYTLGFNVPEEAPAGTYHLEISALDAAGNAVQAAGQPLKATVPLEVRSPEPVKEPGAEKTTQAPAVPTLSNATIQPSTAWIDDRIVVTVAIADPDKQVAKADGVVVEYPEMVTPLNDQGKGDDKVAGDGIWSGGSDIPSEAFEGTYHIAIWPKNAAGGAFKADGEFVKATVTLTLKPGAKAEQPAPAPAPAPAVAAAGPGLSDAKIEPATVKPGGHVIITVAAADPAKAMAKLEAIVTEYPVMKLPLNDAGQGDDKTAGDGIYTLGLTVPEEAPAGTYHLEISALDAAGNAIQAAGQPLKATVPLEVKSPEAVAEPNADALRTAAAPWRTEAQIAKIKAIARKPDEPFRFVVMGDSRSNPEVFAKLLSIAAGLPKFDFSVNTGDIVPGGKPAQYEFFYQQIKGVTWPFLVVEGNHELGPTGGRLYEELFGPTDYYFDHGGIRFVGLNNAKGVVTPQQLKWLDQALTTDLRKIVFFHAPPSVIPEWAFHSFSMGAEELTDLLASKKVERAYVGHIHGFDVANYKGVEYVLSGGGGAGLAAQLAPGNFHHIVLVEVFPEGLRETVYKLDGTSFMIDPQKWISGAGQ